MRSEKYIMTAKAGYIVISALMCIIGILFITVPTMTVTAIERAFGIIIILFGAIKLIGYFSKDLYRLAFQYDLALGVLLIALGAIMLLKPGSVLNFICIGSGIYILLDGLLKIQISLDSKRFGIGRWWLIMAVAILTGIVGILLIVRPSESMRFITVLLGISLLFEGILNLVTVITAVKVIRHKLRTPDVIDIEVSDE